ncbi:MAG TPA: HAMP domain-containing sensor histidine kinase [Ktedonobacteraceae bacterium]
MQTRISSQRPQKGPLQKRSQHRVVLLSRFRSSRFGYIAGLLLTVAMVYGDKLYDYISSISMFDAAPFGIASVLVALMWGLRPALFTITIGLIAIATFIAAPDIMTSNIGQDIAIFAPFTVLQILAVAVAMRFEAAKRRILAARQTAQMYAQELETANQRLVEVNEQLERANYLKDYVIVRSSHELRTPMTTILGRTQLALHRLNRSGETPENWSAVRQYLEIIEEHAQSLGELINDLFDLSSIRLGKLPLQKTQYDLASLCREVIKDEQASSGRSVELELPSEPLLLQADEKRLVQVLVNLVDNAVKYSPENTPIHVCARPEDSHVILEVHNEGTALTQAQLEHIFEPFYRTLDAEASPAKGWGLGLTIAREIVELHGGQIWAESSEGKGITFFVKLPVSQDNPEQTSP